MLANLYIVAAPSGAGKTSLVDALLKTLANVKVSISHTTRKPRPGEVDGKNYFFITKEQFQAKIAHHDFLEYAEVFENYYGTSVSFVEQQLSQGTDVILEIDWQGARQIKAKFQYSIGIFILPPSLDILRQRLQNRAQDNEEVIAKRMAAAGNEMSHYKEYEYLVVNDDFDHAVEQLKSIILANRCLKRIQAEKHQGLLAELLP